MNGVFTIFLCSVAAVITGCATSSTITDANTSESEFEKALIYDGERSEIQSPLPGIPTHRIFHQGATGFTPVTAVRSSAMERVVEFCKLKGQEPYLVEETTSKPPHILGNWPRIEIVFSCIEGKSERMAPADKYDQLIKLKSLLDSGALTQQEYDQEKAKLLTE